jgi:hypothetical protein
MTHTVDTMHWFSRIAPQQPKKLITKMILPRTTMMMGTVAGLFSGNASLMSSSLNSGMAPTTMSAIPATCSERGGQKFVRKIRACSLPWRVIFPNKLTVILSPRCCLTKRAIALYESHFLSLAPVTKVLLTHSLFTP